MIASSSSCPSDVDSAPSSSGCTTLDERRLCVHSTSTSLGIHSSSAKELARAVLATYLRRVFSSSSFRRLLATARSWAMRALAEATDFRLSTGASELDCASLSTSSSTKALSFSNAILASRIHLRLSAIVAPSMLPASVPGSASPSQSGRALRRRASPASKLARFWTRNSCGSSGLEARREAMAASTSPVTSLAPRYLRSTRALSSVSERFILPAP